MKLFRLLSLFLLAACTSQSESQKTATPVLPKGMTVTFSNGSAEPHNDTQGTNDPAASKCEVEMITCEGSKSPLKKIASVSTRPKIFVLWATWCHFCKPLLSDYTSLKTSYPNIDFLTLASDKKSQLQEVKKVLTTYGLLSGNFLIDSEDDGSIDPRNEAMTEQFMKCIGVDFQGYPTTFITDATGSVVFSMAGYDDSSKAILRKQLAKLNTNQ